VNGYKAIALVAEQVNEQDASQSIRILNYVIDILNGMELTDQLSAGTLIKIVE